MNTRQALEDELQKIDYKINKILMQMGKLRRKKDQISLILRQEVYKIKPGDIVVYKNIF